MHLCLLIFKIQFSSWKDVSNINIGKLRSNNYKCFSKCEEKDRHLNNALITTWVKTLKPDYVCRSERIEILLKSNNYHGDKY